MMYAVGILRTVNNSHGILSFNVHEIINQLEYQAFTLEAKVAKLYFEKNVPFMLRTGSQQNLGPFTPVQSLLQAMSLLANHSQQLDGIRCMSFAQPYDTNSPSTSGARTLNDQCREIIDLLNWKRHRYGTLGLSAVQIAKALETADLDVVQDNLLFLIREGRIYNTCDRNHYALAKE
ncbi:unnamed protein product [Cylicostephanus goldi]|uniref:Replication protein A C-terminal domain-containing protein n=1 Tax=Cylicostephanus goldi TaxID=71465 RepID=A0A3P6SZF3_CYLGO|nr:unnamed protein product [Cylicostephanus goldi]